MDFEDKDWAQLAPLLLQNDDNGFPDSLHPYLSGTKNIFDDLHAGAAHDAHALFGAPDYSSVSAPNLARSNGELQQELAVNNYGNRGSCLRGTVGAGSGEIKLPVEQTAYGTDPNAQRGLQLNRAEESQCLGAAYDQQQQLPAPTGSLSVEVKQQHSQAVPTSLPSAQPYAAIPQQQQQTSSSHSLLQQHQPVQVDLAQLQALQQQQAFTGYQPQQIWGLQQQLWTLQQQSALIAAQQQQQQQQQQQFGGIAITAPQVLLPMGLPIGFNSGTTAAGGVGSMAYSYSMLNQHQQQQQQHQHQAGFAAVAQSPNGGLQLYGISPGLQQAAALAAGRFGLAGAAAAAAANGNKQLHAGSHGGNSAAAGVASPSAMAAAAAAAMAAASGQYYGKPTAGAKKQRERHRNVVSTLEAEVAEKMAQLQMLSAENEMLKLRAAVLEATVASREDQMRVISEHGPPVYPIDIPDQPQVASSSDTASPSSATSAAPLQHSDSAKMPASPLDELRSSASTAGELVAQPPTPRTAVDAVTEAPAGPEVDGNVGTGQDVEAPNSLPAAAFGAKVANNDEFWPNVQKGREVIKRMSVEDVVRHWRRFLQEVTGELVIVQREEGMLAFNGSRPAAAAAAGDAAAVGQEESSACTKRIKDLVEKYSFLIKTAQQLNPGAYCRLFGQNLDTGLPAPYCDAHWRRVVAVLGLSKQQVNHILACAELYFSCRAKLQNEQRALQQQLKAASASAAESLLLTNPQDDSPMKPWLDKLANNLKREHVLRVMLNGFVWFKVFTPVQCAKAAVYSHPFYVDVHAMVCVMCEDALSTPASSSQMPLVFSHRTEQAV